MTTGQDAPATREHVRERYAAAAIKVLDGKASGGCCGSASGDSSCGPTAVEAEEGFGSQLYSASERGELPGAAVEASLGCGNPLMVADLNAMIDKGVQHADVLTSVILNCVPTQLS